MSKKNSIQPRFYMESNVAREREFLNNKIKDLSTEKEIFKATIRGRDQELTAANAVIEKQNKLIKELRADLELYSGGEI